MRSYNQLRRRHLQTPFVHVPAIDWAKVRVGVKREFRTHTNGGNHQWTQSRNAIEFPFPVVAWCQTRLGERLEELMWLEDAWQEPLRAIGPESLEREGFADRREFRRYWISRHPKGGWRGMTNVAVLRVRPLPVEDLPEAKDLLFEHLYGPWLDGR